MKRRDSCWWLGAVILLLFACWHNLDVNAAVTETGDRWLTGGYLLVVAAVLVSVLAAGSLLLRGRRDGAAEKSGARSGGKSGDGSGGRSGIRLEQAYPVVGLLFGLLFLVVLPPLSAPDEISHYVSAYKLSGRLLGQPSCDRYGRVLLRAEDAWVEDLEGVREYEADEDGYLQPETESAQGNIALGRRLDESVYELFWELGITGSYMPERTAALGGAYVSSRNPPVTTTPLAYVPQALGIALARALHCNTVVLLYLGRLMNLLFFVMMTWLALRRLPFGKEVLAGVALLPMTLHLSASFSYDVMILGCMFLFTAVCLDLAFKKERVTWQDVLTLMILMAVAGPCKLVYAPMMGLCLLIPVSRFGGWGRWAVAALFVGGAWAVSMYVVNSQVLVSYATETDAYVFWAEEPGYSLTLLLHQPVRLVRMFYQTLLWQTEAYYKGMIGAWLGNLDPVLDVPYPVVAVFTLCLLALALRKPGENLELGKKQRIWICTVCAGCAAVIMLSMLIAWTPLSSRVIEGVQGRYFLPFLPVLLMALKNNTVVLTKGRNRSILYLMCCLDGYVLMRLFSIVSMCL